MEYRLILVTPDVHVIGDVVVIDGEPFPVERRVELMPSERDDRVVVTHQKYVRDYSHRSTRPFRVNSRAFKTLGAAMRYAARLLKINAGCYHYKACSEGQDVPDLDLVRCADCPLREAKD